MTVNSLSLLINAYVRPYLITNKKQTLSTKWLTLAILRNSICRPACTNIPTRLVGEGFPTMLVVESFPTRLVGTAYNSESCLWGGTDRHTYLLTYTSNLLRIL